MNGARNYRPFDGADAGFDPEDHTEIDPRLGTWDDLQALSKDLSVTADLIVNPIGPARTADSRSDRRPRDRDPHRQQPARRRFGSVQPGPVPGQLHVLRCGRGRRRSLPAGPSRPVVRAGHTPDLLRATGTGRDVNRHRYTAEEIQAELRRPVVRALLTALRFRTAHPAFGGAFSHHITGKRTTLRWILGQAEAILDADFMTGRWAVRASGRSGIQLIMDTTTWRI